MKMAIFARSKNKADMGVDPNEKYIPRRWMKLTSSETVTFGIVLSLIFMILHLVIVQSSFVASPQRTTTPQDSNNEQRNGLLGGLLPPDFDRESCISRYKSSMYRRASPFPVSSYLIQKLRSYEKHHRKCGPGTKEYQKAVEGLKSGKSSNHSDCQYIIWKQCCGVGNRMLSLVSTFLFSLLTNRVMLFETSDGRTYDLFCEPFPNTTWLLPYDYDFPFKDSWKFDKDSQESYLSLVKHKRLHKDVNTSLESLPAFVYLPLKSDNYRFANHIFCTKDQKILQKINWIVLNSDSYFAPALFLIPMYKEELENMFPLKESVFHHLGRYLLQPANPVWELIERYYQTYLADVDERIGLQVRIFKNSNVTFEKLFDRILECSRNTNLFPELGPENQTNSLYDSKKQKAILVVSLFSEFYEKLKSMYCENSTVTGEKVGVYQPSHEQTEQFDINSHSKALAEIFLLSYCDKIATTSRSTFGYVSYSLAGVRPWIIRLSPGLVHDRIGRACVRPGSIEPCSQSSPTLKCNGQVDLNATELFPFIRSCEDGPGGLKIFS